MSVVLQHAHATLGSIPGPLALAVFGDVIWAAGGGRGDSAFFRFTHDTGWLRFRSAAHGLRAALPLSAERALIVGEHGFAAVIDSTGGERVFHTDTNGCLFTLAPTADGGFLAAGDDGEAWLLHVEALEARKTTLGTTARVVQLEAQLLVTANGLMRGRELLLPTAAPLTRLATSPDGVIAVTGDANQLYLGREPDALERFDTSALGSVDLECVLWHRDAFIVGTSGGLGRVDVANKCVTRLGGAPSDERVTSLVPWRSGLLGASWRQVGPPFSFVASIFFEGDEAPSLVKSAERQSIPAPRVRTVALDVTDFLDASAGQRLTLEEAKRRLPNRFWPPSTNHGSVRYFDGHVRVANVDELLSDTSRGGFAVVINGHLVVDGFLDAVAGGDGYDSFLVVNGDLHAKSARIADYSVVVGNHVEVETALLCNNGDGGILMADKVTAQVFSYASQFQLPSCPIDAFCIGDVGGDASFPPERAREVFVDEVLDKAGYLSERAAHVLLAEGRAIIRRA